MAKKKKDKPSTKPKPIDYVFGRPTLYDPKYCSMLIKHMTSGLSFDSFSAVADVNVDTLYEWAKVHPAFSEAKKIAYQKNLYYWEMQGIKGMWEDSDGPKLNSTVWIFNMKARHKWAERQSLEIKTEDTQLVEREKLRKMPMSELTKLVKENIKEDI